MKIPQKHARFALAIASIIILMLSTSCGGGGGGGSSEDDGGLTVSEYNFGLDLDLDGTDVTPFQVEAMNSGVFIPFEGVGGNPLGTDFNGTMELSEENDEVAISSITIDDTTAFYVDVSDIWDSTQLMITVVEPIVLEDGNDPSDGSFTMDNGTDDPITVSFSQDGDVSWVNISGVSNPVELDDFKDYLETSSDALLQQSSVAYHMIEMLYDQVTFIAAMIIKIDSDELGTVHGDANTGLSDPTGGTLTLSCTSGSVVPGADFSVVFDNFWQDDPDDDMDTLIDGSVSLLGYLKIETNDVLENIGFAWGDGAGVFYGEDGVSFYETEETGGVLTQEWTHTIYGSYSIVFSVP
ncbi:MAG TPA: hypothetical protein PLT09_09670 [Deltaproteobacteria bacterium]|nr:hypothetical protein [Deltaproteobacteria bacterium]HPR55832.1 hypothetical protein [Deltaproteobacteria bacterium]HXK47699.1 hypothetical protein [Deltaproteobacteria bacterium]